MRTENGLVRCGLLSDHVIVDVVDVVVVDAEVSVEVEKSGKVVSITLTKTRDFNYRLFTFFSPWASFDVRT